MRRALFFALLAVVACKHEAPKATSEEAAAPPPQPSAAPDASTEVVMGPTGSRATDVSLLSGELRANRFPLAATADGGNVDYELREEISPLGHRGKVKLGKLELPKGMSEPDVRRALEARFERFVGCYRRGLANNPNLQGAVAVRFTLDASGAVEKTENAGSDVPDSGVVRCIVERAKLAELPKSEKGVSFLIKLELTPE